MTDSTLLPCPFCGSEDLRCEATCALEIKGSTSQSCWIECFQCGAQGPVLDIGDAEGCVSADYQAVRDAWNRRSIAPDIALLRANLSKLYE